MSTPAENVDEKVGEDVKPLDLPSIPEGVSVPPSHPMATILNPQLYNQLRVTAKHFAGSNFVPKRFKENPMDVFIALHMAYRLGCDPLLILQNSHIVHGEPGFKSSFMIAQANRSGVFKGRMRFKTEQLGEAIPIQRTVTEWVNGQKRSSKVDAKVPNIAVTASAILADDPDGESVTRRVTMEEAILAGWTDNPKYSEIGEQMLTYRAATFLIRLYALDTMMLPPDSELEDIAFGEPEPRNITPRGNEDEIGADDITARLRAAAEAQTSPPAPAEDDIADGEIVERVAGTFKDDAADANQGQVVSGETAPGETAAPEAKPAEDAAETAAHLLQLIADAESLEDLDYIRSRNQERDATPQSKGAVTRSIDEKAKKIQAATSG